jgi:hypothetical protein
MPDWMDVERKQPRTPHNKESMPVLKEALEYDDPGVKLDSVTGTHPYGGQTKSEFVD